MILVNMHALILISNDIMKAYSIQIDLKTGKRKEDPCKKGQAATFRSSNSLQENKQA